MKNFNYTAIKRQMTEDAFKEQHEKEKQDAQNTVDSVLYADATMRERGGQSSETPSESTVVEQNVESASDDNIASAETTDEVESETIPDTPDTYTIAGSYRDESTTDDFADDAEEDAVVAEPPGENDIEEPEGVQQEDPYTNHDDEQNDSSEDDIDNEQSLPETDDEDEIRRREEEAALREQTAASNRRNPVRPKVKSSQTNDPNDIPTTTIKKFPKELVQYIKALFPEARTQDDALAAYVYLKEGEPDDIPVPKEIKQLAKTYIGEAVTFKDVQDDFSKELQRLREYNTKVMKKLNAVELVASYIIFDRLGFRKATSLTPSELNFLEAGMSDLIKQLEKQSEIKQNRDAQKNGRPIK